MNQDPVFISRVENALSQLRPYLEADGSDGSIVEITSEMILKLKLHGVCSNCSVSMMTLKAGIEQAILRAVPEIKGVESVTEEALEEELLKKGI